MSNAGKRVEGKVEEIGGKIKGAVGSVIGNRRMQAEGKATELKGESRQQVAKASERAKGSIEQLGGKAKKAVGSLIGNRQMKAQGKATELKGGARKAASQ